MPADARLFRESGDPIDTALIHKMMKEHAAAGKVLISRVKTRASFSASFRYVYTRTPEVLAS